MNFAEVIKKEILNKAIKEKHCRKAFLAGIIRGAGELYFNDDEMGLDIKVNSEEVALAVSNYLFSILKFGNMYVIIMQPKKQKGAYYETY